MRFFIAAALFAASICHAQESNYIFGFLRAYPNRATIPNDKAQEIQNQHMEHLNAMGKSLKLVGAGPLKDSPDLRGVLIFKGITLDEARRMAAEDPSVQNKRLVIDLAQWLGVTKVGDKVIAKYKADPNADFKMTTKTLVVYWKTPKTPANWTAPENEATLAAHGKRVQSLFADHTLVTAGPFAESKDFVGVFVFNQPDTAAALASAQQDPMVKAGWARPEAYIWFVGEDVLP